MVKGVKRRMKMKRVIHTIVMIIVGAGMGAAVVGSAMKNWMNDWKKMSDKHLALFLMMNQWVKVKQNGKNLVDYFEKNNFKKIAIYGMSYAGETLVDELKESTIEVLYGIDKKSDNIYADFDIVSPDTDLKEVDAVVVTSITFFDEIEEQLSKKLGCPIISLEDILYEV